MIRRNLVGLALVATMALALASCARPREGVLPAVAGGPVPIQPENVREDAQPLRILCWNLEHFVDHFDDPYVDDPRENAGAVKSDPVLRLLALAISKIDADVMAFQEIESDRLAKFFLDNYLPDHDYRYYAAVPAIDWYQNVVIVSRLPLGPIVSFREVEMDNPLAGRVSNMFNNRLVGVEVRPHEDYSFLLINAHLKAGGGEEDALWRKLQVDVFREFLEEQATGRPDLHAAVVGDMNFTPGSPEYGYMLEGGTMRFHDPFAKWGHPPSHSTAGPSRKIDHILFNGPMFSRYISGTAGIAKPLSIDQLSTISDHLPLVASILPPPPVE